jgi:hypothetical protein
MFATISAYKNAAIGLVLLAALAFAGVQSYRLNTRTLELAVSQADIKTLGAMVGAQNAGIQAVKDAGAKAIDAGAKANANAAKAREAAEARAQRLEAMPTPIDCNAALQLLITDALQ